MKQTIISAIALLAITFSSLAQNEVLLGEYNFNDATNFYQIGGSNAVQMGTIFKTNDGWTTTINDGGNGLYRAVNTKDRNYGFIPMGAYIEPKAGFIIKITKVEISHRAVASAVGITRKFGYYVGTTNTVNSSTDISTADTIPTSAPSFTTRTFTLTTPVEITDSRFWFNYRIHTNLTGYTSTTEIDYVKFYGTYVDPFQPSIIVSTEIKTMKGAPITTTSSQTFTIDHRNLTDLITASSSKSNFNAYFADAEDGIYKQLKVDFTPTKVGYDTTQITLTSGAVSAVLQVRAWGLPQNTLAAWSFDNQDLTPEFLLNEQNIPIIEPIGGSTGKYVLVDNTYSYEVNNLYTTNGSTEVPEIAGLKISNLGYNGDVSLIFDLTGRNYAPNTLKAGSYASGQQTLTGVYWKNPRITFKREAGVTLNFQVFNGELAMVSAFDQTLTPPRFKYISNTLDKAFDNVTGWALDNIIVTTDTPSSVNETFVKKQSNLTYNANNQLYIRNNQGEAKVAIYTTDGKLAKSGIISGNSGMSIAGLKGIYFVRISKDEQISHEKVLFQN